MKRKKTRRKGLELAHDCALCTMTDPTLPLKSEKTANSLHFKDLERDQGRKLSTKLFFLPPNLSWVSLPAGSLALSAVWPYISVTLYSPWDTYDIYKTNRLESCFRQASHCRQRRIVAFLQHVLITREIFSVICNPAIEEKPHTHT